MIQTKFEFRQEPTFRLNEKKEQMIKRHIVDYIKIFRTKKQILNYLNEWGYEVDERLLRIYIRDLIFEGMPIISECFDKQKGYKIESDVKKLQNNAERLKKRAIKIMERAQKLEKIILELQNKKLF